MRDGWANPKSSWSTLLEVGFQHGIGKFLVGWPHSTTPASGEIDGDFVIGHASGIKKRDAVFFQLGNASKPPIGILRKDDLIPQPRIHSVFP